MDVIESAPATPEPFLERGSVVATLSIPRLDLSAVVLHGSDAQTLRRGPGHVEHTALPGERGNTVIAGHRDSFFWPLRHIRQGDDIFLETVRGQFLYQVVSLSVVDPHDMSVLEPTDDAMLTLITCYPFWVLGQAPDRFIVRAARVPGPATASSAPAAAMSRQEPVQAVSAPVSMVPERGDSTRSSAVASTGALLREFEPDDGTLVRQTIERFRITYNARLAGRPDPDAAAPLVFERCDVEFASGHTSATCLAPAGPGNGDVHVWTFLLEATGDGWAIRFITRT